MRECVLVADDDREIVAAIAILLKKEGYEVLKAYDGLQALELAVERRVQLLIVDVMMPKLDGLSAVMKLRERRNIPIIVLSAKSEDSDKILGLSIGADDYVTKPFHPQELVARVRSQLRRYNSLGDARSSGEKSLIRNGRLAYSTEERCLYADGEPVRLTAPETGSGWMIRSGLPEDSALLLRLSASCSMRYLPDSLSDFLSQMRRRSKWRRHS